MDFCQSQLHWGRSSVGYTRLVESFLSVEPAIWLLNSMFSGCCVAFALLWHDIVVNLLASALLKVFEEKSNVRTGNSLVAECCNQFSFCSAFTTGVYSFSLLCFLYIPLQIHQNPKGV